MMKKSLVLAMAMALGISATAFAANPFSDVPAGHWAYASVAKLAAAGIVDGYPDGTFKGDNLMTRYEMAQIVAKAYAKGGIGADDKLMAEFADELDNLGVRVAKLEKKADNVKITGEARFGYKDFDAKLSSPMLPSIDEWDADPIPGLAFGNHSVKAKAHEAALRTRLYLSGAINDDWNYGAMLQNTQNLDTNAQESTTSFRRAFVNGKIGEVEMTAGRQAFTIGEGYVADLTGDAVKLDFGKKLKTTVFAGRFDSVAYDTSALLGITGVGAALNYAMDEGEIDEDDVDMALAATASNTKTTLYGVNFAYDFTDKFYGNAGFYAREGHNIGNYSEEDAKLAEQKIYTAGLGYKFDKNVKLYAEYQKADKSMADAVEIDGASVSYWEPDAVNYAGIGDDGWAATLYYKGANPMDKGSWGAYASYYDQSGAVLLDSICELEDNMPAILGMKGYEIGTSYTLAKNITGKLSYFDLKNKDGRGFGEYEQKLIWSTVTFNF